MHYLPLTCMLYVLIVAAVTAQDQLEPTSDNEGVLGVMYIIGWTTTYMYSVSHTDIAFTGTGKEAPNGVYGAASVVYGKLIYIIRDNMVYNSDNGIYTRISHNITPRWSRPAAFIIDYRLYVVGGYAIAHSGGTAQSDMESLSLHTLHNQDWRLETAVLPQPTRNFDGCALGQTAIVAGGYVEKDWAGYTTNHTYTWQPGQPSWSRVHDMNEARQSHCMVCAEAHFWVIGGYDLNDGNVLLSMERYSLDRDDWEVMASLPERRSGHGCVYDGAGRIIVTGGANGVDDLEKSNIFIYNMAQNIWGEAETSLNNGVYGHVAAFIPG